MGSSGCFTFNSKALSASVCVKYIYPNPNNLLIHTYSRGSRVLDDREGPHLGRSPLLYGRYGRAPHTLARFHESLPTPPGRKGRSGCKVASPEIRLIARIPLPTPGRRGRSGHKVAAPGTRLSAKDFPSYSPSRRGWLGCKVPSPELVQVPGFPFHPPGRRGRSGRKVASPKFAKVPGFQTHPPGRRGWWGRKVASLEIR
jgi:hypothetical protein